MKNLIRVFGLEMETLGKLIKNLQSYVTLSYSPELLAATNVFFI